MVDALQSAIMLHLRTPEGRRVLFEADSHDTIATVRKKVEMKINGVVFDDDLSKRTVELYTYGNGLMVVVGGIPWGGRSADGAFKIARVEVDGRMLRFGGAGMTGVTIPKAQADKEGRLLARIRQVFEDARVEHNVPPPIVLRKTHGSSAQAKSKIRIVHGSASDKSMAKKPRARTQEVLLLNGMKGVLHEGSGDYVHSTTCSGKCGGRCYPAGQPSQSWGSLLRGAAARGDITEVKRLLASGAALEDTSTETGMAPLHYAARHGHVDTVRLLLEAGAFSAAPDLQGLTPLDLARKYTHPKCVELIEAAGFPLGRAYPGDSKYRTAPGVSGDDALAKEWQTWVLKDLRRAKAKDMIDLSSQPWDVGVEVQVRHQLRAVEALCREAWAGWSQAKEATIGRKGVVTRVRRIPVEQQLRHRMLLEIMFHPTEAERAAARPTLKYWYPSSALIAPFGDKPDRKSAYAAAPEILTPESTARYRLMLAGRILLDHEVLWECGVKDGDTIQALRSDGGYDYWGALGNPARTAHRPTDDPNTLPTGFFETFIN